MHVSASVPPISGICTYGSRASRASRASMMAGMTVRVGTYQQYQRPSQMVGTCACNCACVLCWWPNIIVCRRIRPRRERESACV